jgi:hypothetical protein
MQSDQNKYFIFKHLPINPEQLEEYCGNTIAGIMQWIDVTMKDYTDAQYGKGDIKKLINYDEIKILQRNV